MWGERERETKRKREEGSAAAFSSGKAGDRASSAFVRKVFAET